MSSAGAEPGDSTGANELLDPVALLRREGFVDTELDDTLLEELDSILVAELLLAVGEQVGHLVEPDAFDPQTTSLGDVVRFGQHGSA